MESLLSDTFLIPGLCGGVEVGWVRMRAEGWWWREDTQAHRYQPAGVINFSKRKAVHYLAFGHAGSWETVI